jgi:hypothetical protein
MTTLETKKKIFVRKLKFLNITLPQYLAVITPHAVFFPSDQYFLSRVRNRFYNASIIAQLKKKENKYSYKTKENL